MSANRLLARSSPAMIWSAGTQAAALPDPPRAAATAVSAPHGTMSDPAARLAASTRRVTVETE